MKIVQMQIFVCEFCQRKMFGKGAMSLHERQCKQNPNNKHKCFQFCKNLNKGFDRESGETVFTCELQPKLSLYSYKLERFSCHTNRIKYLTRMPLECDLYESQTIEILDSLPKLPKEMDYDYFQEPDIY